MGRDIARLKIRRTKAQQELTKAKQLESAFERQAGEVLTQSKDYEQVVARCEEGIAHALQEKADFAIEMEEQPKEEAKVGPKAGDKMVGSLVTKCRATQLQKVSYYSSQILLRIFSGDPSYFPGYLLGSSPK